MKREIHSSNRQTRRVGNHIFIPGVVFSILSEYVVPDEVDAFDALSQRLTQLGVDENEEAIA
jgi:hypothetical protein